MNPQKELNSVRRRRAHRVGVRVHGSTEQPRLAIFRSNRAISAQLIDDAAGKTLVAVSSKEIAKGKNNKTQLAALTGGALAKKALAAGVKKASVDRRWYRYHGRVKAFVEAARQAGLAC